MSKKMQRLFSLLCVAAMLFTCTAFSEEEVPGGASEPYAEMSAPEETYAGEPAREEPAKEEPSDARETETPAEEAAGAPAAEEASGEEASEAPAAEEASGEETSEAPAAEEASGEETSEAPAAEEASGEEAAEKPAAEEASGEEAAEEPAAEEASGEEAAEEPAAEEASGEEAAEEPAADESAQGASSVSANIQVSVNGDGADSVRILQYPGCSVVRLAVDQNRHLNLVLEADMNFVVSRVYEPEYSAYSEPHYRYSENNRLVMKFDARAGSYLLFVYAAEYNKTGTLNIRLLDDSRYAAYAAGGGSPKTAAPAEESVPAEDHADPGEAASAEETAPATEIVSGEETAPAQGPADEDQPVPAQEPAPGEEAAYEPVPGDESEKAEEPASAGEPAPAQEPASGEEISDEPAPGDGTEPSGEPVPPEKPAPAEEADLSDPAAIDAEAPEAAPVASETAAGEESAPEAAVPESPAAEEPAGELNVDPSALYVAFSITWDDEVPSFGSVAHLDAVLDGFEGLDFSLQWQYSEDNLVWTDVEGETQSRMDTVITEENYLYYWRVMVYISVPAEG